MSFYNKPFYGARALLLASAAFCISAVLAETPADEPQGKMFYEFHEHDGVMYRMDKRTGKVEKLVFTAQGIEALEVPVMESNKAPYSPQAKKTPLPAKTEDGLAQLNEEIGKKKDLGPIAVWDEKGMDITEQITDAERQAAVADIAAYDKDLSKSLVINSGDRITGIIMVRNNGARRLQTLELTLLVPVNNKEKPEEYCFLYVDKGGPIGPPQPGSKGGEGMPLMQKVDLPLPPNGVKGNPELKITYLKFNDK